MPDDRQRPPRRPPAGRRPTYLAGHRRREGIAAQEPLTTAAPDEPEEAHTPVAPVAPTEPSAAAEPGSDGVSSPPLDQAPWARLPAAEPGGTAPAAAPAPAAATEPDLTAGADAPAGPRRAALGRSRLLPAVLLAASIALVVGAGFLVRAAYNHHETPARIDAARKASIAAAERAAKPLLSYDYRTIDKQVASAKPYLTASCATSYAHTIGTLVKPLAVDNKAALTADVRGVAVRDVTTNRATALVFVDQSSTNSARSDTRVDQVALSLGMVKRHGSWLVNTATTSGNTPNPQSPC